MRRLSMILLILFILVVAGCSTIGKTSKDGIDSNLQNEGDQKKKEILPIKEVYYFNDGFVEKYKLSTYKDDLSLLTEDIYDIFDKIIESSVYEKRYGDKQRVIIYDKRGNLKEWKIITFLPDKNLPISEELYNENDEIKEKTVYKYDLQGKLLKTTTKNSNDELVKLTEFYYENGLNTRIELKDYLERLTEYEILTYLDNHLIEKKIFYSDRHIKETLRYVNNDKGYPSKIEHFSEDGLLKGSVIIEYRNFSKTADAQE